VFQHPVAPERLRGRDDEIDRVCRAVSAGNAITVAGPRRYGKTSVLLAVAQRLAGDGHPVALVDLYATASVADLVVRLERAWAGTQSRWVDRAERWLDAANLGLSLKGAGIGVTFQRQPRTDPYPALHRLLDLPTHLAAEGRRAIVILDEFQSLEAVPGVEGVLRGHVQHQRDVAGYVFAGSEPHLLDRMFGDPDRPFFGQALRLRLGRLPRQSLADTITDEFVRTERHPGDALGTLLDSVAGHPQRAMLAAHFLWETTPVGQVATLDTWGRALAAARDQVAGEVEAAFDRLTANQKRVLRSLAHGQSPFAVASRESLGLPGGSVHKTLDQCRRDGLVEPGRTDDDLPAIIDPMLADWIRSRFPS
jgi:uncharacterized protein